MSEEQQIPAEGEATGDDTGTNVGEEKWQGLTSEDLDEMVAAIAPERFVAKAQVDEIVKQRLESEREQRKAENERKALEQQNEFKKLYEDEKTAREKLEEDRESEAQARRQDLIRFELRDALRDDGIQPGYLPLALQVADISTVEIVNGEVKGVSGVVEAVKKASPVWFGAEHERLPRTPDGKDSKRDIASEISKRRRDKLPAHLRPNS